MILIRHGCSLADPLAASMFRDRKRQFVDQLGWDVPVVAGQYEIDHYDGGNAHYLIAVDADGEHAGSMRLLPTIRPHLLADHFAGLCDGEIPCGPHVMEITRLCLPSRLGRDGRRAVRNRLISAMTDHALQSRVSVLTGVVTAVFRETVLAMGWRAAPLGPARTHQGSSIGAFRLDIGADTPALLAATGIYAPDTIAAAAAELA
ncbi:MAG TPA: acyl-homoserine-lactone synthase [Sphingopyxis sp.]|uniref:acyl-homoserine-lactone synthase n=1 Tax=Sphingopyxis sp. TaxID=1908224 RepID=UPI002E356678|nr:acyl-homoserine-lactone synthase [Sphingopyxis sp.]HEX2814595.1 acyl-homoserine-lactone synthase [Sphingopyxis sp.]